MLLAEPIVSQGWTLERPRDEDIIELMRWLPDAESVDRWGGPRIRFPFTQETFRADCRINEILTYCLRSPRGRMSAFGQIYERYDRGHLARLITHPDMRRRGIGTRLIDMLCRAAERHFGYSRFSLFVYRDNEPAYRCYLAMGFVVQEYPDDAPLRDKCYFLTSENSASRTAAIGAARVEPDGRRR